MTLSDTVLASSPIELVLSRLPSAKRQGDKWLALCPAHDDHDPSLSISEGDDSRALLKCFAGCSAEAIVGVLGLRMSDLFPKGIGGDISGGLLCQHVNGASKQAQKGVDTSFDTRVNGVNLNTLAEAKKLPVDFLKSLGVTDFKYNGVPSVRIPYYGLDGQEFAVRFRLALSGDDRFRWRRGDSAMPYGLNRLAQIREAGWTLLVEGETDCWTCWYHKIPALGAPGKGIWPLAWGEYLRGLDVYVWQEPNAEDFVLRVLKAAPDLRYIRAPDGIKDISEAHIQDHDVVSLIKLLKAEAELGRELKARYDSKRLSELYTQARPIIEAGDPLETVKAAIRGLGYGGDIKPALIVYLAATSRLLAMRQGSMPVHLVLIGPASSGKSYTINTITSLLPTEACYSVDAGSPRVILYNDAELHHRLLIFGEADSLPAGEDSAPASAIRNLLQDHYLHYEVTIRDKETGDYTVRQVNKPGPTVLITTSIRSLGAQLMSRLFSLEIGDSNEQIGAALETQGELEVEASKPLDEALIAFQAYLQLKAPIAVIVPFAPMLARGMAKQGSAPRILRDFARLMSLIKSVTILRHKRREVDDQGRLVATLADYETVRQLVANMYVQSTSGATAEIRALVEAVKTLDAKRGEGERITNTVLAKELSTGVKQITRRARRAIRLGWLVNREQRKSYPADYALGEPMPETEGLPVLTVDRVDIVDNGVSNDFSFKNGGVDTLTPLTDSNIHPPCVDHTCPHCGGVTERQGNIEIDGESRFRCKDCDKVEWQPLTELDKGPEVAMQLIMEAIS